MKKPNLFLAMILLTTSAQATSSVSVELNGKKLTFDVEPQIINERTMVPLRTIFEELGASVEWNQETKTVNSQKDNTNISLTIGKPYMLVNGKSVTLDSPACVIDDRTLVPVRAISEAYNANVVWDDASKTVKISSISLSYEEALKIANSYVKEMLSESDDLFFADTINIVSHNKKPAYEFVCYSKSMIADGETGYLGTFYVYEDKTIGGE